MNRSPLEQQLSDRLARLADYAVTAPRTERTAAEVVAVPARRERRVVAFIAAASVVVLVTGAVVVATANRNQPPAPLSVPPGTAHVAGNETLSYLLKPGATRDLPPAPIAGRADLSAVWDGTELLVWGGDTPHASGSEPTEHADGAGYNPRTNTWRMLPTAPLAARSSSSSVWTGHEMIIWGGTDGRRAFGDGAAYDPATNTWRRLAAAPIRDASLTPAVWTGHEMILVGGLTPSDSQAFTPGSADIDRDAAAYDPANDRWTRLPDAPDTINPPYPEALWTGREAVFVLGNALTAYTPSSNQWTSLTSLSAGVGHLVWTGRRLLDVPGSAADVDGAGEFDLDTRTWSKTVSAPSLFGGHLSQWPVWTGTELIFWPGGNIGLAYTPETDSWRDYAAGDLPNRTDGVAVWADGVLITWGGVIGGPAPSAGPDGLLFRPR